MVRPQFKKKNETHTHKNKILGSSEGTEGKKTHSVVQKAKLCHPGPRQPFNLVKPQFSHLLITRKLFTSEKPYHAQVDF